MLKSVVALLPGELDNTTGNEQKKNRQQKQISQLLNLISLGTDSVKILNKTRPGDLVMSDPIG